MLSSTPAGGGTRRSPFTEPATGGSRRRRLSPLTSAEALPHAGGRGEPHAALRNPSGHLAAHLGQPRPSSLQPDYALLGPTIPIALCRARRRTRHRPTH